MNAISHWLHSGIFEETDEGEAENIFNRNAFKIGWKLALGEPFDADSQHLDQLCSSIKAARDLFPKDEDGFIKLSSSDDKT